MAVVGALPRGEAARIVRVGLLKAHPWIRLHIRQERPVPNAVRLEAVQRAIADLLGWDALNDLAGLSVHRDAIEAEVYDIAVDSIYIRII